jgi:hypothetical protein
MPPRRCKSFARPRRPARAAVHARPFTPPNSHARPARQPCSDSSAEGPRICPARPSARVTTSSSPPSPVYRRRSEEEGSICRRARYGERDGDEQPTSFPRGTKVAARWRWRLQQRPRPARQNTGAKMLPDTGASSRAHAHRRSPRRPGRRRRRPPVPGARAADTRHFLQIRSRLPQICRERRMPRGVEAAAEQQQRRDA